MGSCFPSRPLYCCCLNSSKSTLGNAFAMYITTDGEKGKRGRPLLQPSSQKNKSGTGGSLCKRSRDQERERERERELNISIFSCKASLNIPYFAPFFCSFSFPIFLLTLFFQKDYRDCLVIRQGSPRFIHLSPSNYSNPNLSQSFSQYIHSLVNSNISYFLDSIIRLYSLSCIFCWVGRRRI